VDNTLDDLFLEQRFKFMFLCAQYSGLRHMPFFKNIFLPVHLNLGSRRIVTTTLAITARIIFIGLAGFLALT
jgi:hypothetical protein